MLTSGAHQRLWDNCLELEAYIQSHSVNNVYRLDGKVQETYKSGETADISQFFELAWYDWIMHCRGTIDYWDEPLCQGNYLEPGIDVGPAMTAKILQHNGKVVYCSTYCPLAIEEQANHAVKQDMATLRETTEERLGAELTHAELEEIGITDTLEYIPYADQDWNEMTFTDLDEEVTPEVGDEYMHASIMLLHGSQMMHGTVRA